jgi:hypothetical protein
MNAQQVTNTNPPLGAATLDSLEGLLKDVYLPGITNTLFFDNKFTRLIKSEAGNLDASGRQIVKAFQTQRSGGVGPMTEGGGFRDSVPVDGFQGYEFLKYCNMYVEFTGPAIATVQAGVGSYIDVVDSHLQSMAQSAQLDLERVLMGCGDGRVATVSSTASLTTSAGVLGIDGPGFFDAQFVEDGMYIECIAPVTGAVSNVTSRISGTGTSSWIINSHTQGNKRTSTNGTITLNSAQDGTNNTIATNDWIIRKGAYGAINATSSSFSQYCLETNGLCNLVSDGKTSAARGYSDNNSWLPTNETTDNYAKVWNTTRSTYPQSLESFTYNINAELDEENLLQVLIESEHQNQTNPNLLVVTPRAVLKYFMNMRDDRRFNTMEAMNWTGGYTGLGIQLGDKKLMVTGLNSVPTGMGFLINTNDFAFVRPPGMSGYRWLTGEGGGILTQKEASDQKFATAVDYWAFVCNNPRKQTKLYNITE